MENKGGDDRRSNANNCPRPVDSVWIAKKLEMNNRGTLRGIREGSRNAFTAGNGHHLGATPGRGWSWETGASRGCLALAGGSPHRGRRATGRRGAGRPGGGPSISYLGWTFLLSAAVRRLRHGRGGGRQPGPGVARCRRPPP